MKIENYMILPCLWICKAKNSTLVEIIIEIISNQHIFSHIIYSDSNGNRLDLIFDTGEQITIWEDGSNFIFVYDKKRKTMSTSEIIDQFSMIVSKDNAFFNKMKREFK